MWQRIQTIYLAFAALLSGGSLSPLPYNQSGSLLQTMNSSVVLIVLCALIAVVSLASITQFRNRNLQINLCRMVLLLLAVSIGVAIWLAYQAAGTDTPQLGAAFLPLSIITIVLAMRGIRADERLIRSMDRLR